MKYDLFLDGSPGSRQYMQCKYFCIKLLVNTSFVYIWALFDRNSHGAQATNSYFHSDKAVRHLDLRHLAVKIVLANFREKEEPGQKKPITFIGNLVPRVSSSVIWERPNLVSRACDPWEGNEGSGIIHVRNEYDWLLVYNGMLQFCKN
jgi:hypothetical protein